jgi:hypothetical protein
MSHKFSTMTSRRFQDYTELIWKVTVMAFLRMKGRKLNRKRKIKCKK